MFLSRWSTSPRPLKITTDCNALETSSATKATEINYNCYLGAAHNNSATCGISRSSMRPREAAKMRAPIRPSNRSISRMIKTGLKTIAARLKLLRASSSSLNQIRFIKRRKTGSMVSHSYRVGSRITQVSFSNMITQWGARVSNCPWDICLVHWRKVSALTGIERSSSSIPSRKTWTRSRQRPARQKWWRSIMSVIRPQWREKSVTTVVLYLDQSRSMIKREQQEKIIKGRATNLTLQELPLGQLLPLGNRWLASQTRTSRTGAVLIHYLAKMW